jgi:hypothetical protein
VPLHLAVFCSLITNMRREGTTGAATDHTEQHGLAAPYSGVCVCCPVSDLSTVLSVNQTCRITAAQDGTVNA